ncbi:sugar ABC transporter substrate-binding protein [Spirochaetia bacterium]|nr:sugar ABC transporter substrate-binding protein [Spirochaetia bacterium]
MKACWRVGVLSFSLFLSASVAFAVGQRDTGELLFWTSSTGKQATAVKAVVDAYNATNPAVKVKMVQVPGSETDATNLMTAVRGGTGPDVYMLDRFTVAQRAADGILEDLSGELAKLDPNLGTKYVDFAWQESRFRGKTYALPLEAGTRGLFYNKTVLRENGIDPAVMDWKNGPLTVDQIHEIARKIDKKDAEGNYTQIGFIPQQGQGWHYTWGYAFGGSFADLKAGKVTPTNSGVVAGMQFLYDWNKEMGPQQVQTFISTYAPPGNPPQQDPFIVGRLAMLVNTSGYPANLTMYGPDVDWDVTWIPIPKEGDRPSSWCGGWSLVAPTGTKLKEAAAKFIYYACGPEGNRIYCKANSSFPALLEIQNDESIYVPKTEALRAMLPYSYNRPPLPVGALYWDALGAAQDAVCSNLKTPQVALKEVEDSVQPQLNRFLPLQ